MQDPPKGTQKEFASTMKVSSSKGLKGKAIKHSFPGIGRPTSIKSELTKSSQDVSQYRMQQC